MRLLSYEYRDLGPRGWTFYKSELSRVNLLVGDSASGKTRFLNTIFNLCLTVTEKRPLPAPTQWKLSFIHNDIKYDWRIRTDHDSNNKAFVLEEHLTQYEGSSRKTIIQRIPSEFNFNGIHLPKLRSDNLSISILKEEELIKPIFEGFSHILRRRFFSDALQDVQPTIEPNPGYLNSPAKSLSDIYNMDPHPTLNLKLFILRKKFPDIYAKICESFMSVFGFVTDVDVKDIRDIMPRAIIPIPAPTPIFAIQEKGVKNWLGINELSSGMQKVMLIITDTLSLPNGSTYLLDEYENSLGVSAIDFLPSFLDTIENEIQFLITSHHPYLINNIPADNWLVFRRRGSRVKIRYGQENIVHYGTSKQQRFIQLINDPFYAENNE